jgi:hypothetical protein
MVSLWAASALSLLAACGSSDVASGRAQLEKCTLSSDCKQGLYCALGSCRTPCKESRDCGNGGACVSDGVSAACQLADEKETACAKTRDCPVPLACAGDYRCRNLCDADEDCNVLGINGRVCAADNLGRSYCAEPKEVEDGVITVEPPAGALISIPENALADSGNNTQPDAATLADAGSAGTVDGGADAGMDGGGAVGMDGSMDAAAGADAAVSADAAGGAGDGGLGDAGPKLCTPACGLGFQCSEGTCSACGAENQACCGSFCNANLSCSNATCACGLPGEKCCGGSVCDNGVMCKEGTCACGAAGQSCCPGVAENACGAALACAGRSCSCIASVSYDLVQRTDATLWAYPPVNGPPTQLTLSNGMPLKVKSFGQGSGFNCAVSLEGNVWCWNTSGGTNNVGQLGNSTVTPSSVPVQVVTNLAGTTPLANIESIAVGSQTSCAVSNAGAVWCWGGGSSSLLGTGPSNNNSAYAVPVVSAAGAGQLTGVAKLSMAQAHACALKTDNTLWCWGNNQQGQTGVVGATPTPYPTNVANLQGRTRDIAVTGSTSCAVLDDGLVYCFGAAGGLGRNQPTNSAMPAPVLLRAETGGELKGASRVFGNWSSLCALIDPSGDRSVYCWSSGYAVARSTTTGFAVQGVHLVGVTSPSYTTYVDANGVFYRQDAPANPAIPCP